MNLPLVRLISLTTIILFTLTSGVVHGEDGKMYPMDSPLEPTAIPLNTGGVDTQAHEESWFRQWGDPMARNISKATLTPFIADPKIATGVSVIVAPGGGFKWLSMGNEGWEVAEALNAQGINAFVLKYRLQPTAETLEGFEREMNARFTETQENSLKEKRKKSRRDLSNQLEDVAAAYTMINKRAKEWNVEKDKVGMIGFSAGAGLTLAAVLEAKEINLAFVGLIYGMMEPVDLPANAPPMFAVIAADDFLFHGQFGLIESWYKAKIPVEFHLYQNGGHGFGLGNPDKTSNQWFNAFIKWLKANKISINDN